MPPDENSNVTPRQSQAPEGGWGWMTVGAVIICNLTAIPIVQFFAFIFRDLADSLELTVLQSSIVLVLNLSIGYFVNVFINLISSQFSTRRISFFGALITFVGFCCLSYAKYFYQVLIAYGILIGIGTKLVLLTSMMVTNQYFVKRQKTVQKLILMSLGLGFVVVPQFLILLLFFYTIRETVFILGAVSSHLFLAAVILQPVEYHILSQIENGNEKEMTILTHSKSQHTNNSHKDVQSNGIEDAVKKMDENKPFLKNGEILDSMPPNNVVLQVQTSSDKYISLLTNPSFICVTTGIVCNTIAEGVFGFLLPFMLFDFRFPMNQIAIALSIFTGIMISLRYFFTFAFPYKWSPSVISILSIVFLIFARIAIALGFISNFYTMLIAASSIGASKGVLLAFIDKINPNKFSKDLLPYVTNVQNLSCGFGLIIFGPVLGFLRDLSGTYQYTMLCINILNSTCILMWALELLISYINN